MKTVFLTLIAIACASCATTTFKSYEGSGVIQGTGGTREVIDGIDFWENGSPPRKFRIMGVIDDERPGGIIPMHALKRDVARKAKESGADAVVIIGNDSRITGYVGNAQAFTNVYPGFAATTTFGSSTAVRRNSAKFAAIKYL